MTKTIPQAAAIVLSALMTLAVVGGMNGIAGQQYRKADREVMAGGASQRVTMVGYRVNSKG